MIVVLFTGSVADGDGRAAGAGFLAADGEREGGTGGGGDQPFDVATTPVGVAGGEVERGVLADPSGEVDELLLRLTGRRDQARAGWEGELGQERPAFPGRLGALAPGGREEAIVADIGPDPMDAGLDLLGTAGDDPELRR